MVILEAADRTYCGDDKLVDSTGRCWIGEVVRPFAAAKAEREKSGGTGLDDELDLAERACLRFHAACERSAKLLTGDDASIDVSSSVSSCVDRRSRRSRVLDLTFLRRFS